MKVTASNQIITPTCRENRGNEGAIDEALERVKLAYMDSVFTSEEGTNWRVLLIREDDE